MTAAPTTKLARSADALLPTFPLVLIDLSGTGAGPFVSASMTVDGTGAILTPALDGTVAALGTQLASILTKLGTKLSVSIDGESIAVNLPAGLAQDATLGALGVALTGFATANHADLGSATAKMEAVRALLAAALTVNLPAGAATDASLQALRTALGSPLQGGGAVSVSNWPATQAVSAAALPLPLGAATEATLGAIRTALLSQADIVESLWVDPTSGTYYLRRVTDTDGAVAVTWTDAGGNAASPTVANLRPLASDNALTVTNAFYDVTSGGAGTSLGDVLNRVIIINKAVSPPVVAGALWINATTGLSIAEPAAGSYVEATRDVAITSSVLPTGAATAALQPALINGRAGVDAAVFAPVRGATVALTAGPTPTAAPVALPACAATSYRVRNAAGSASPIAWTLSISAATVPALPAAYGVSGTGGAPGDKTIDPGGVEVIGLTAGQQAALAAGALYLSAVCPAGGSATLTITPGTGA